MAILLTGAEGMIGSNLSLALQNKGHEVLHFEGDVTKKNRWDQYRNQRYDAVIHLAAFAGVRPSLEDPDAYFHNNITSTEHALVFGQDHTNKMLYASSSNAYEWWGNPYAATKKMNEVQGRLFKSIGMRFHTVWPGREDMLYRKLQKGEVTHVNVHHYRDFIHVSDLVNGIITIMDNFDKVYADKYGVCDIGTGHPIPVAEVAKLMGFAGEYRDENPKGERIKTCADVEYLLQLGWTPKHNIMDLKSHT